MSKNHVTIFRACGRRSICEPWTNVSWKYQQKHILYMIPIERWGNWFRYRIVDIYGQTKKLKVTWNLQDKVIVKVDFYWITETLEKYFSDLDPWKLWRFLMITSWYSKLVVLATIYSFISSFEIFIGGISSWENCNIFFIFNNINSKIILIIIFWYIIRLNVRWITHPKKMI